MAKIYRAYQIKLNQLVYEDVRMITDLPTKCFKCYVAVTNISQSFTYKMA